MESTILGTVTGDYGYTSEQAHGFVRTADGTITAFDPPGSTSTLAMAINDAGTVAGFYLDGIGHVHGYVRTIDGTVTTSDAEDGGYTYTRGISSKGATTGFVFDSNQQYSQAFVRSLGGKIYQINPFGSTETAAYGINASGRLRGFSCVNGRALDGFVANAKGHIKSFDVPQAIDTGGAKHKRLGEVTGSYDDANYGVHGFIRTADGQITTLTFPDATAHLPSRSTTRAR